MIVHNIWVFRLSLTSGGEPQSDKCMISDRNYIKNRVKQLKESMKPPESTTTEKVTIELLTNEFYEKGKLRQGWGMAYGDINVDLNLKLDDWIANFIYLHNELWQEDIDCFIACGRYNILKQMKDMSQGDIVFVPRTPDEDSFTVATVKKGYSFDPLTDTFENGRPYKRHGHIVNVDKSTIKKFNYSDTFRPKVFNPYQRAVCKVEDDHKNYQFLNGFVDTHYI